MTPDTPVSASTTASAATPPPLLGALKTLIDTGDEAAADLDLTMIISDDRQLDMLPDLPHVKICSPTGPLEPTASLQLNKYAPDVVFLPPCRPSAPPDASSS